MRPTGGSETPRKGEKKYTETNQPGGRLPRDARRVFFLCAGWGVFFCEVIARRPREKKERAPLGTGPAPTRSTRAVTPLVLRPGYPAGWSHRAIVGILGRP